MSQQDMIWKKYICLVFLVVVCQECLQDGDIVDCPAHDVQHLRHPVLLNCHVRQARVHGLGPQHAVDKLHLSHLLPEF